MNENEVVDILWTGGWDSSYRMVELSRKEITVQPIYFFGDGRSSQNYERKAMKNILRALEIKKETKAKIRPIKFIHIDEIPKNKNITDAYNRIYEETKLGSQHEWLARYAFENPGIEIGTESTPLHLSKILNTINKHGKLISDEENQTYRLDKENSDQDVTYVLGNFSYPIVDKTGKDMLNNIKEWDYEDVMKYVWVCHTPIMGKPCGTCHPCELKIETGMDFLMKPVSLRRYSKRHNRFFSRIYNLEKGISYKIDTIINS